MKGARATTDFNQLVQFNRARVICQTNREIFPRSQLIQFTRLIWQNQLIRPGPVPSSQSYFLLIWFQAFEFLQTFFCLSALNLKHLINLLPIFYWPRRFSFPTSSENYSACVLDLSFPKSTTLVNKKKHLQLFFDELDGSF